MQLSRIIRFFGLLFGLFGLLPASALADAQIPQNASGEAVFRGSYWRDRNTRVLNPTADVRQDLPNGVSLGAHYLLDAITSASVASGASADMPFTELRHEAGLNISVPLPGKTRLSANYSYSTESDYWSHNAGVRALFNLFQDNTTLLFGADYGYNTVGKRLTAATYLVEGTMQSEHLVALWTQTLTRRSLLTASYEVTFVQGYQNNPYRPAFVGGPSGLERRETENLPDSRIRHVLALSGHVMLLTENSLIPHVTLRPGMRVHLDSWGMKALNPEFATYVPVGPTEFRLLLSYYDQKEVDFYRADGGGRAGYVQDTPSYANGAVPWGTTISNGQEVANLVYTSDVKLGSYSTYNWELMIKWRLSLLRHHLGRFGERMSRAVVELSGGMWFADRAVGFQYGIPFTSNDPLAPAGCSQICGAGYANFGLYIPL